MYVLLINKRDAPAAIYAVMQGKGVIENETSINERGKQQLADYLDYFHLKKGYMLSYNFNAKKEIGVKETVIGDRMLIEAVV